METISKQQCVVNLTPKVKCNDFIYARIENGSYQVGEILDIHNDLALMRWYISSNELPENTQQLSTSNVPIKFDESELIEDPTKSDNIAFNKILGKCTVQKKREYDTLIQRSHAKSSMAYICRYKLIKGTIGYRLEPISWLPDDEDRRCADEYTDTDTQSETIVVDLHATLDQIHVSLTKGIENDDDDSDADSEQSRPRHRRQQVSPITIKNKSTVHKSTKNHNKSRSENKRASPDASMGNQDVSPSKRNKLTDAYNSYSAHESPDTRTGRQHSSPAIGQMEKVKKNLSRLSFSAADEMDVDDTLNTTMDDTQNSLYEIKPETNTGHSIKMTLRKQKNDEKTPLKEHNDNTLNTPKLDKGVVAQRSIMKTLATPRTRNSMHMNVSFDTAAKTPVDTPISTPQRATRRAKEQASVNIIATRDSPESPEKPRTRRKTTSEMSPPSTPKAVSTPRALRAGRASVMPQTPKTPKTPRTPKTPKSTHMTPQQTRSLFRSGNLTPSIQSRKESIGRQQSELEIIRERLQVSAVPASLPCREKEYASIYEFVMGKLKDGTGGCIYISGVPGTGKTATVTQVIKAIQSVSKSKKLPAFDFVDVNGMRLTEPRQTYVQIYRQLTGKTLAWAQARDLLEARFTAGAKRTIRPTILLVDELDIICNRKQDVVYNLFDWTVRKGSRLIAITIANTMDLPERVLKLKVASRLGLTRVTFQPYTFKQLQEVVMTRLAGSNCFMADAVQLVARKVASVSGDCRRALDICRRATEIAEENSTRAKKQIEINFGHITQALNEMFASPKVRAIKNCSKFEKLFLQAVASEITRTGIEEVEFQRVYWQIGTLAPILGIQNPPTEDQAMLICITLSANRLLIAEDSSAGLYQKIILNATVDDLYYALNLS